MKIMDLATFVSAGQIRKLNLFNLVLPNEFDKFINLCKVHNVVLNKYYIQLKCSHQKSIINKPARNEKYICCHSLKS